MLSDLTLPVTLTCPAGELSLRTATEEDVDVIVKMLVDDEISRARGDRVHPDDRPYQLAGLRRILDEPSNHLVVLEEGDQVIGTLQLTRVPGMTRRGANRLLVESVRIRSDRRSGGRGAALLRWVMDRAAEELGCAVVELTSSVARTGARRFYERLGFECGHLGFKYVRG